MDSGFGHQDFASHRNDDRRVWAAASSRARSPPPTATIRVLAALRRFLREGTPWRSLIATTEQASGATLRRSLRRWAETGLLAQVHAMLVGMLRGHPDLILDTCSVRAKRGGDLTGPNPTDRAKRGTKYHVAVDGTGVPVASWLRPPMGYKNLWRSDLFKRALI
jgi:transposase